MNGKPQLCFRPDGTFRILHLTDLQEGIHPKKDTLRLIYALLDASDPDLVILTGDQLKGYSPWFRILGEASVRKTINTLVSPMENLGIPYAVTFGNHDIQCGLSNEDQAALYRQYPHGICPDDAPCAGTFLLPVQSSDGREKLRLYLLDSGNLTDHGSYAPPSDTVLDWLRSTLFDQQGKASVIPSMVFQHIPLPEYRKCRDVVIHEPICSPDQDTGEFELLRLNGNVMAVFCGHDHKNDFLGKIDGIGLGYTPSSGFACYGPGVNRGGRVITLHESQPMTYETEVLRYCNLVAPHTGNRLKEYLDTHVPTCWPGSKKENTTEDLSHE